MLFCLHNISHGSNRISGGQSSYFSVILVQEMDDPNVVFKSDNVRLRKRLQIGHVRGRSVKNAERIL